MGITSNKDINELARKALRLGWNVFVSGRNHIRWVPPDDIVQKYGKAYVTTSLTPSDNYAINQIERDLRKAGLWHLEETLAKAKLDQTQEEKYLDLGTSLPIPQNPTLRDVAPPELLNGSAPQQQDEVGSMAKTKRVSRAGLRSEILRVLNGSITPLTAAQILQRVDPAEAKGVNSLKVQHVVNNMMRDSDPPLVRAVQKGLYTLPQHMPEQAKAPPKQDNGPNDQEILDNALAAIAHLEKLVNRLRQESAAMEAVRKLLGAR